MEAILPKLFENLSADEKSVHVLDYVKGRASNDMAEQIRRSAETDMQIAEEIAY